jgi:hypothetical protein
MINNCFTFWKIAYKNPQKMFYVPSSPLVRIRGSYQALTTAAALILTYFVKVLFCEFFAQLLW